MSIERYDPTEKSEIIHTSPIEDTFHIVPKESQEDLSYSHIPYISSPEGRELIKNKKKIEIIVHPLYNLIVDTFENTSTYNESDKKFEPQNTSQIQDTMIKVFEKKWIKWLVEEKCKHLLEHISSSKAEWDAVPGSIVALKDLIEERNIYTQEIPEDTARIYLMPTYKDLGSTQKTIAKAFTEFAYSPRSLVMESVAKENGNISDIDRETCRKLFKKEKNIIISGWYVSACVKNLSHHLYDIQQTNWMKLEANFIGLTDRAIQIQEHRDIDIAPFLDDHVSTAPQIELWKSYIIEAKEFLQNNVWLITDLNEELKKMYLEWAKRFDITVWDEFWAITMDWELIEID